MNGLDPLVVFRLEEQRYALPLPVVERVVRAAEVTRLPQAPAVVQGAIDIQGIVLPVLDMRRRLGLGQRSITPSDQFLIARMNRRQVVLVVDETQGVVAAPPGGIVASAAVTPGLEQIQGLMQLPDGLVLIQDLDRFLSLDEALALDRSLAQASTHAG